MFVKKLKSAVGSLLAVVTLAMPVMTQLNLGALAQTSGSITTVAGNGLEGFAGDGGPAISAQVNNPEGIAADPLGNLYIADTQNHRIRKVTPDGLITTVAGNGTNGYGGDGGPAVLAQLYSPTGVAVDPLGNLYIADFNNHRVRKVAPDGLISTVAGGGSESLGESGPAASAQLTLPSSVTVDSRGNLYLADGFYMPNWISEGVNEGIRINPLIHHIHAVTPGGLISVVAGGALDGAGDGDLATSAQLSMPTSVAVDLTGNLYIAETYGHRIRRVTSDGFIATVAGNGTSGFSGDGGAAIMAQLKSPTGVTIDWAGSLYIVDAGNDRIRKVTPDGLISTVAQLNSPYDIAIDPAGNLFVAESMGNRIQKVSNSADVIRTDTTYFPQIAVGGGWHTVFAFTNPSPREAQTRLVFTDRYGNPLTVYGELTDSFRSTPNAYLAPTSIFVITVPPAQTIFLATTALSVQDELRTGWAQLESETKTLTALTTYVPEFGASTPCIVNVPQSYLLQYATVPVDLDSGQNRLIAYAIANPSEKTVDVRVELIAQDSSLIDDAVTVSVGPGQQISRYLHEDLSFVEYKGSLVFRTQGGQSFVLVTLLQHQHSFTALPIIPGRILGKLD